MNKLLIYEAPLQVLPTLAEKIGLNEAIFLQQLHYWLNHSNNKRDGYRWVYNTIPEWQEEFKFWSKSTIKRVVKELEDQGLIITTSEYNKIKIDKTKWYRIDYEKMDDILSENTRDHIESSRGQNDPSRGQIEPTNNHKITTININNNEQPNAFAFYQQNFGVASSFINEDIGYWIDDLSEELVVEAMKRALAENKPKWNYAKSILIAWHGRNAKTLEDVAALDTEFQNSRQQGQPKRKGPRREDFNLDD